MKLSRIFLCVGTGTILTVAGLFGAGINSTNETAATPPVYVPDASRANGPLPSGVLAWNTTALYTNAAANQDQAHFTFGFTNVSSENVVILDVHPSCGCTTAELPQKPWTIPPGGSGKIPATVNLDVAGHEGILFKTLKVSTDQGWMELAMRITILPPVIPTLSDADRARGVAMAKMNRQAVFSGDCATCHVKPGEGKYGKALYDSVCAVCHEAQHRATMVPDLHNLKVPTNEAFWRMWIAHGKPGTLMPAFSTAEGGPLNDMQIASLAAYLNFAIPSHVFPPPATNAPAGN